MTLYETEKAQGVRRSNGAKNLTKLTGKHLRLITLHMSGMKAGQIGLMMGVTESWISTILNDPLAKEVIQKRFVDLDSEMFARSCEVVTNALSDEDHALQLRAADMVWRSRGRYDKKVDDRPTAEDVVRKMLELASGTGGTVSLTATASRNPGPIIDPLIEESLPRAERAGEPTPSVAGEPTGER